MLVHLRRRTVGEDCGLPPSNAAISVDRQDALRQRLDLSEELDLERSNAASDDEAGVGQAQSKAIIYLGVLAVYPTFHATGFSEEAQARTFIQDSVALANTLYVNSGVNARYTLPIRGLTPSAEPMERCMGWWGRSNG